MKIINILIILLLFSFISCKKEIKKTPFEKNKVENKIIEIKKNEDKKSSNIDLVLLEFEFKELLQKTMIGLEVNKEEKKTSKRYSIDASGVCYGCNIANITFTDKKIILSNVCEDSEKHTFDIIKIEKENKIYKVFFILKENNVVLNISKVELLPIYHIKIKGNNYKEIDDFKINDFYTFKKSITKLEVHDCGDFDG